MSSNATDTARAIVNLIADSLEDYTTPQEIDAWIALAVPVIDEALAAAAVRAASAASTVWRERAQADEEELSEILVEAAHSGVPILMRGSPDLKQVVNGLISRVRAAEKERERLSRRVEELEAELTETAEALRLSRILTDKHRRQVCFEPGCGEIAQPYCPRHRGDWQDVPSPPPAPQPSEPMPVVRCSDEPSAACDCGCNTQPSEPAPPTPTQQEPRRAVGFGAACTCDDAGSLGPCPACAMGLEG